MGIEPLPTSPGRALEVMEGSELVAETLGEHVFDFFLRNKRAEWEDYRAPGHAVRARPLPAALCSRSSTAMPAASLARTRFDLGSAARLAGSAFAEPERPSGCCRPRACAVFVDPWTTLFEDGLPTALSRRADPDLALLGLVRVARGAAAVRRRARRRAVERLRSVIADAAPLRPARDRLVAVLGGSTALVDHLVAPPRALARASPRRDRRRPRKACAPTSSRRSAGGRRRPVRRTTRLRVAYRRAAARASPRST